MLFALAVKVIHVAEWHRNFITASRALDQVASGVHPNCWPTKRNQDLRTKEIVVAVHGVFDAQCIIEEIGFGALSLVFKLTRYGKAVLMKLVA